MKLRSNVIKSRPVVDLYRTGTYTIITIYPKKMRQIEITLTIDQCINMLQHAKTIKMTATLRAHQFVIIAPG